MVLDMSISSCAILVCSDRCFNGESEDRSGKALEKIVREELDCQNTILKIVPGTCSRFWVVSSLATSPIQVWDRFDSGSGQVRFRFGTGPIQIWDWSDSDLGLVRFKLGTGLI